MEAMATCHGLTCLTFLHQGKSHPLLSDTIDNNASVPEKGFIPLNHSSIIKHVLPGTVNNESIKYILSVNNKV